MKNNNEYFEALRHLSRNENIVQEAWEKWNEIEWETDFNEDCLKEGDCVVYTDSTIGFCENNWGKNYANQNSGFVLYSNGAMLLTDLQELIEEKMHELKSQGFGSDDC